MSAPKVGDRVQAVLLDIERTELPGMVGTVIPRDEWPAGFPGRWSEGDTIFVRWDRGSHSVYTSSTRALRVLEPASEPIYLALDGAVMKRHTTDPDLEDLRDAGWAEIDDDGTEAESLAEVSVPAAAFVLNQRVEVVEPKHPLFGRQGRVYRAKPDSLGRIRVDVDRAPDGMHDGWHAIEAWCLAPVVEVSVPAFPDVLAHGRARSLA